MQRPQTFIAFALLGFAISVAISSTVQAGESVRSTVDSLLWNDHVTSSFILQTLSTAQIGNVTGAEFTNLTYKGAGDIRVSHTWQRPWGTLHQDLFPADSGWFYSPDSSKALWLLRYWGEPESALDLFNRHGDSLVEQLAMCGTPCQYLGVRWVDQYRFVFVNTHEHFESRGERPSLTWYNGFVSLYDLASDSVYQYASDPILRRPSLHVDSMISLIWDNPVAVHFIHTTFEEAGIPGFEDKSLSFFDFHDSILIDLGPSKLVEPISMDTLSSVGLWLCSPDSSRSATIVPCAGDSTELWVYGSCGDSTTVRVGYSDATRHQLSLRWLNDDLLLVLRVDEDGRFSQRRGHRVIDGHVAAVILYNLERGYQLRFGSYIMMPD